MPGYPDVDGTVMEPLRGEDPRRVGRYTLVARLGAGGMGQVFLGFSPAGRPMAVKVVHPELARDKAFLSRFKQEVASARKVSGAYTAAVVDAGDGDPPWFATTLVVGPSLAEAVEQLGPLPGISVWRLAAGLAEALAEVHSCGLVHRDLKPSNVLLAADGPRLIDFGISRALDGTAMTGTGMVVGTPGFMSPEQASGTPVGPASDVFSFGGVLTFAATGSGPFGDGTAVAMIYRVVHGEPSLADLPGTLPDLVSRCLVKRPEDRATLPELMEIITANVGPVTSATSFWPEALTDFIGSYQARFAADTRAWSSTATGLATPPTADEPAAVPTAESIAGPRGSGDWHPPTDAAAPGGQQDGAVTLTAQRATPAPPAVAPTAVSPPVAPTAVPPPETPPASRPGRWTRRRGLLAAGIGTLAAAVVAIVVVLATSVSPAPPPARHQTNPQPPGGFGAIPAESGTPHAGTLSLAEQDGNPDWILPVATVADNYSGNVADFDYLMWRPLYWADQGVSAKVDPAMSLAEPPVWSNGDTTVTVTMNPRYRWSDGQPVSAEDVAFAIDLIQAAVKENPDNWWNNSPGLFPHDLAAMSTPNQSTLVLTLTSPVNPIWFYEDELAAIQPMPAHAWAKAAANGPILDPSNPANAKKIYDYLVSQSYAIKTWAANPLWQTVDGPYRLTAFNSKTWDDTMTANPSYGGPDSHEITTLNAVYFDSDAAEINALEAGRIDLGYIPNDEATQVPRVRSLGYDVFGYPSIGFTYAVYNFKDTTGDFDHIAAQLYFRQAMAHLENQQQYIDTLMQGQGSPDYGPIAPLPVNPYTPGNATSDPYPFSVSAAKNLLASHGWTVVPDGTDFCLNPGSGAGQCGADIPEGTRLAFNLIYDHSTPLTQQMVTALAGEARQAGITINLQASSFNAIISNDSDTTAPANSDKWAMEDFGVFTPDAYPTTLGAFNTGGIFNAGGYSDPEADKLIDASVSSNDPNAVKSEAAYLTAQQPGLFQPNADYVFAWAKTLSGPPDSFANLTQSYLTPEQWYFTR